MKRFPSEFRLAFKIFIFILWQIRHFCHFLKNHVLSFLLMYCLCFIKGSHLLIFENVICIILKVPPIRILLSIRSLNGKIRLSEGHPRFLSLFPFVNRQIKSIV